VATPQVVVNGRSDVVGDNSDDLSRLIRRADRGDGGPRLALSGDKVWVSGAAGAGLVLLVRYDPNIIQVAIKHGENGGLTLPHRNVVRQLTRLGDWTGGSMSFNLPPVATPGLKTAILVQQGPGGPILAALRL
jgi:hypothetical protein